MGMFGSSDPTLLFRLLHSFKPDLQLAASEHSRVLGMDSIMPDAPGSSGPATPPQHVQVGHSGTVMLDTQARLQVRSLRAWCLFHAFLYTGRPVPAFTALHLQVFITPTGQRAFHQPARLNHQRLQCSHLLQPHRTQLLQAAAQSYQGPKIRCAPCESTAAVSELDQ